MKNIANIFMQIVKIVFQTIENLSRYDNEEYKRKSDFKVKKLY